MKTQVIAATLMSVLATTAFAKSADRANVAGPGNADSHLFANTTPDGAANATINQSLIPTTNLMTSVVPSNTPDAGMVKAPVISPDTSDSRVTKVNARSLDAIPGGSRDQNKTDIRGQRLDMSKVYNGVRAGLPKIVHPVQHDTQAVMVSKHYLDQDTAKIIRAQSLDNAGLSHVVAPNMEEATLLQATVSQVGDFITVDLYGDNMINYDATYLKDVILATDKTVYLSAAAIDDIIEHSVSPEANEANSVQVEGTRVHLVIQ